MARKKNPRRVLLEMLKTPRERVNWIHSRWTIGKRLWDTAAGVLRDRRPDEYPEDDPAQWTNAYVQVVNAIYELRAIADYIVRERQAAQERSRP